MTRKHSALSVVLAVPLAVSACNSGPSAKIPVKKDWHDQGVVLKTGPAGSWDARLTGMISPAAVVKKNGVYYLYYIGADGDRSTDDGPRHRALGVATSRDGIHFTKYDHNPVLEYLPHNNQEEGIFAAGAWLDGAGTIHLYYGANNAGNATSTSVHENIRLATSSDGFHFTDHGDVIRWADKSVWGYGDELSPIGVYVHAGTWHVYYIAKGSKGLWKLAVASGPSDTALPDTQSVITSGAYVKGGGDVRLLNGSTGATYVLRVDDGATYLQGYTFPLNAPADFSAPVKAYSFPKDKQATTVFIDKKAGKAFMYIIDISHDAILVKTAALRPSLTKAGGNADPAREPATQN